MKLKTYQKLNLGCGTTYRKDWINIDLISNAPEVIAFDLKLGIPFGNATLDAVYHSHVLEHMTSDDGSKLVTECARVLKPGGILRIAVPDLETLTRVYLEKLENAKNGLPGASDEYQWIVVELLDQMVRSKSGGKMAELLSQKTLPQMPFISERIGQEGLSLRESLLHPEARFGPRRSFIQRIVNGIRSGSIFRLFKSKTLEIFLRILGGESTLCAFREGHFRSTGEVHLWMYDQFSLKQVLESHGFESVRKVQAEESEIEEFSGSGLEIFEGKIRKPDSLFLEGIRSKSF